MSDGTPGAARGVSGMEKIVLAHPSGSVAEVYAHGAHVTSWRTPDGRERLFLSSASRFERGTAIRGGIPVIFPQFADRGPFPRHGFARLAEWRPVSGDDGDRVALELVDDEASRAIWPFAFRAELTVTLAADSLVVELGVTNRGTASFEFTAALHSYLRVSDVERVAIGGLRGRAFESRTEGIARAVETEDERRVAGELDRVYFDVGGPVTVRDPGVRGRVEATGEGFSDVVLWNPGAAKAGALADLGAGEYRAMLCVEAALVGRPVRLERGESWRGAQRLRVAGSGGPAAAGGIAE